ncbi:L,D-transpeptidase family protein [Pokkaliibacter sp. CJK22405]|uniref:L,D-transpeptidase Cds6 family protein n=1 Tax=Pokkaliibacter sp. CJK22405 TaxID=3384615 RepID=UPI0039852D7F
MDKAAKHDSRGWLPALASLPLAISVALISTSSQAATTSPTNQGVKVIEVDTSGAKPASSNQHSAPAKLAAATNPASHQAQTKIPDAKPAKSVAPKAAAEEATIPGHIFSRSPEEQTDILVDKFRKEAYLIKVKNDTPTIIRTFKNLQFGQKDGDKVSEGDMRTPEGVYRITHFIPDQSLLPVYGHGAFPLDYPNPLDRIEGRNGSGIWLHGRDDDDPTKVATRGCVAFENNEIDYLQPILTAGTTVVITPKTEFMTPSAYAKRRASMLGQLDAFIKEWSNADISAVAKMLHPDFRGADGLNREQWVDRKKRLAEMFPERQIKVTDVHAFKEDGNQVVFDFRQQYCAANLFSLDSKRLFFKPEGDKLSLVAEDSTPLSTDGILTAEASDFVAKWMKSWNNNEIFNYLQYYSPNFTYKGGKTLADWKDYKSGIFAERPQQQITYENLKVHQVQPNRYQVSFTQHYTSNSYADDGIKTLTLEGCPGSFAIVDETWKALK